MKHWKQSHHLLQEEDGVSGRSEMMVLCPAGLETAKEMVFPFHLVSAVMIEVMESGCVVAASPVSAAVVAVVALEMGMVELLP